MGAYKLCMQNQIQPDFVSREQVLKGELEKYQLLLLPYSINLSSEMAKAIEGYVRNGGKVISDGLCGYFTDKGWGAEVCPAGGLDQVFGLHVRSDYRTINEEDIILDGRRYEHTAKVIAEKLVLHDNAEAVATLDDGLPVMTKSTYGKGKTVYLGTLFFANAMWNYSADTNRLFKKALDMAEYHSQILLSGPREEQNVEVRILERENDKFVFVINHEAEHIGVSLGLNLGWDAEVTDIVTEQKWGSENVLSQTFHLEPQEVKILYCRKK